MMKREGTERNRPREFVDPSNDVNKKRKRKKRMKHKGDGLRLSDRSKGRGNDAKI